MINASVPADPAAPVPVSGHTPVNIHNELPQVVGDTVTDLLGRPRARGWIHLLSAAAAIVASAALVSVAAMEASPRAVWATLAYTATTVAMFSISAAYHRVHWRSQSAQKWMKRVDHSMIFIFIAGSYTPFALLAMPPRTGTEVLTLVCAGAAAGVVLKMLWPSAPRLVGVPLYLLLGYVAIWFAGTLLDGAGWLWSSYSSPEASCTTLAPSFTASAGPTHGHRRSAITSSFMRSRWPQRSATTAPSGPSCCSHPVDV